jgi:GntR family transcriptional repressor for pyruvate dehydrogenase complex
MEADMDFHLAVSRASANTMAPVLMRPILRPLRDSLVAAVRIPGAVERAIAEHQAILDALQRGDEDRAAAATAAHLGRVIAEIENLYGEGQSPFIEIGVSRPANA